MDIVLIGRLETKTLGAAYNLQEERLEIGWMLAKGILSAYGRWTFKKHLPLNLLSAPFKSLSGIVFKSIFKTTSASKNGI